MALIIGEEKIRWFGWQAIGRPITIGFTGIMFGLNTGVGSILVTITTIAVTN